ncbi:MAG: tRNA pseudouridine synthase B [Gemmatimonadaceae bacterium]|nr:tRNA pseudouridine synthase B [Gemmatimonadaceae bacterium]
MTSTDGFLLVDKPAGITSHDAVSVVRRATGQARVGHTGTLDPFATGLLLMLVGRGTRLARFVSSEPKTYDALVAFGRETTTDDATGDTRCEAELPRAASIPDAIARLTGEIQQIPPVYSAKHVAGKRAYSMARRGVAVQLHPVTVRVHEWCVGALTNGVLRVSIVCAGGTYVRALARDLGRLTGSAAHLAALRRTRAGAFDVANAVTLDAVRAGDFNLCPLRDVVSDLPVEQLTERATVEASHGRTVAATITASRAALIGNEGTLVAVAECENGAWRPRVVLVGA